MDVMMQMTTDDVRRLRPKFTHNLTLEEFVTLMKTSLKDRIHSELDFVVGAIELFHTIDVNGDKTLEWDEFAAYMLDAGQAKADFAGDGTSIDQKAYRPWSLGFRDPKTPMNRIRTFIQELLFLPDMNALAYFEHGADVVHLYGLHFDQNDAPRHLSTIRLHTAFQAHVVITMTYIPIRRWLVISSMLNQAKLSIWEIPDAMASTHQSPMMLNRVELSSPQEQLTWISSLQVLATASVVFPPISSRADSYKPNQPMGHTKIYQLLLWDLATLSTIADFNHRDRIKGISALASFSTPNHRVYLVVGREDGVMSVIETDSGREIQTVDAHAQGVKTMSVSLELEFLASAGFHSYADESTQHILIWRVTSSGRLTSEATLRDHDAAVDTICFVDETQQLVTSDVHGVFRVYASAPRYQQVDRWQCLQVFLASLPRSHACIVVIPETSHSDAVMIATSGSSVSFFDLCVRREREEVLFAFYSSPLNVIIGVTAHRVLLWHAETGKFWKTYEYAALPVPNSTDVKAKDSDEETSLPPRVISAACMDDRERKLLLGDDRGGIRVVNIVNGNVMKALDPHNSAITWLSYVLHAKRVLSISMDAVLHICDENNPLGYYVPFGGGPPQSILLQSLRVHPETDISSLNNATSTKNARYEVFKAIGNHELNLLAVLMLGPHGESFIQLWNFDLGHAQGTCIAPEQEEITCLSFFGSTTEILGGTASGKIWLWSQDPNDGVYRCSVEFDVDRSISKASPCLHLLALASDPNTSSVNSTFLTETDGATLAPSPSSSNVLPTLHHRQTIADRIRREADGIRVMAGDEHGVVTTWCFQRSAHRRFVQEAITSTQATRPRGAGDQNSFFQHEEMAMGHEALAALYEHALRACSRSESKLSASNRLQCRAVAQWQAHRTPVSSLRYAADPLVLISSGTSGKIKIWDLDGQLLGVLDHFATRRAPSTQPWRFPVDMAERQQQQTLQAQRLLDILRQKDKGPKRTLRLSILQRRLSLSPEEMISSRASTPLSPTARDSHSAGSSAREQRRGATTEKSKDGRALSRAARDHVLVQASSKHLTLTRMHSMPSRLHVDSDRNDSSLHTLLTELNEVIPPTTSHVRMHGESFQRKKYSIVTIADLKHALRPRTSSSTIHCELPSVRVPSTAQDKAREVIFVKTAVPDEHARRVELADLRRAHKQVSNQQEQERAEGDQLHTSKSKRPDSVLNYHVKLAHSWQHYHA